MNPTFLSLLTSITSAFRSTGASKCGGFEASIENFLASYWHLPYRKLNLITSCCIVNYYTSVYFPTFIELQNSLHLHNILLFCLYLYLCSSVQLLSHVWLFATPWTAVHQFSLSITNTWSLLKLMSIESVMLSNHLILCHPRLLPPSIFPSIRVFSNESALCIRWPKYWSFSFNISPSNEYSGLISWFS